MASSSTRLRALALYKELHRLGRDYPDPSCVTFLGVAAPGSYTTFMVECVLSSKLHQRDWLRVENRHLTDRDEIENALKLGEYIKKETLALYSLRKYRHLKRMYPDSMSDPQ
ncbi:hypothetical protein CVT26_000263 [Gymnopilus dilepis]|uniref:Uncharacterized protein n=1 Tax=Gymnopilus dilepis TaxID=231916 RepID=A0A409VGB4_9AGAR|nr:hypothetical protein CVT26_000263 [Gymnopilus dilepis]